MSDVPCCCHGDQSRYHDELGEQGAGERIGAFARLVLVRGESLCHDSRLKKQRECHKWQEGDLRSPNMNPADSSSLLNADHSQLGSSQMLVDTALERAEAELSNAVSTSTWQPHSGG